ncbi:MAG TPA: type VI secretion system tip protein TssI/VgrG [Anaeromyxobacter sp.]|nr:type VI secretion system tip protein TssI/VgrG [Anaeromyxobacter sp.]
MPRKDRMHFDLRVGSLGESDVSVRRLHGVEDVSNPYCFEIDFFPVDGVPLDLEALIQSDAALCLRRPTGEERWIHGLCTYADCTGVEAGRPTYQVTIEPKLLLLARRHGCRVFQGQTAPEIVATILKEQGISHRLALSGSYPKRDLCIQYRETELAFVSRLLEDEGIAYWFEHSEQDHVMVLGDAPRAFTELPGPVPHREDKALLDDEPHLYALRFTDEIRQAKVIVRGFEFERPAMDVTAEARDGQGAEVYDYPSGGYPAAEGKRISKTRLEELRATRRVWSGEGTSEQLSAGHVFEVTDHPDDMFDNRLVVLHLEHDGRQQSAMGDVAGIQDGYRNRFKAIEADIPFRPQRRTPRPVLTGPQTATIVGAPGEEIFPDAHGRVKVQFHWDRVGKRDDRASAWVRLAQAWGGPGFGALFVPRIGQEVLVRFLEGNPDRPLVVGALYNGANAPPIALPGDRTQSTLRTDSSPTNGGYNELRFEDAQGEEQIHLHAQKDETIEVRNDKRQQVRANELLRVDGDRSQTVKAYQTLEVFGNDDAEIQGNKSTTIAQDRTTRVYGEHSEQVDGSSSLTVGGSRMVVVYEASAETVGAAAALTVGGAYAVQVAGAESEVVGGLKVVTVAGNRVEAVGGSRDENVGKDAAARVGGDFASDVKGAVRSGVGKDLTEDVGGGTGLEVAGPVGWMGKKFQLEADEVSIVVGGKKVVSLQKSGKVVLAGTSISVAGAGVKLKGAAIKKSGGQGPSGGSANVKKLDPLPGDRASIEIELLDQHGQPMANEPFRVEFPDGKVRTGTTDGSGKATVPGAKEGNCKVTFPFLDGKAWKKG